MLSPSTIKQLLTDASRTIDRLDADVLLAHVLGKPREFLISHNTDQVGFLNVRKFNLLVQKRAQHYPAAQLIGTKGFFGYDFEVNKHTLIPRPDTELLVSLTLDEMQNAECRMQNVILIDVGTGSGCIPIAISKSLTHYPLPLTLYATDISKNALLVAKRNAKKYNVDITFKQGNLLEPFLQTFNIHNSKFIICANLPYLTNEQFTTEPSIQHEPKSALVADNEGLALYEELLKQIQSLISSLQSPITAFFEIDPTQSSAMTSLIKTYFPDATVEIKKDLAGLDRIVHIQLTS